jgi:predicted TIM-barrel fold metal-dependent hydrolase
MLLKENQPHTDSDLLADMDHIGIAEALVIDCLSREHHPIDGNARILETTADQPRLHPAWAALPHAPADEQLQGSDLLNAMRKHKVGALFFYPKHFGFSLSDWEVDAFLEPISAEKIPIFIDYDEIGEPLSWSWDQTDWAAIVALCRRWPELPVIVSEDRIRQGNRLIYRALETCPNLHIELSAYWLHRGIEYISKNWGADRLIFGSNWPRHGYPDTVATLTCADISDEEKLLIGGDNLRQLISWCQPEHPTVSPSEPIDEYVAYARSGKRPENLPAFGDNHGHMGGRASNYHIPECSLKEIVRDIRRFKIEKSVIFSFTGTRSDERPGNDHVTEAINAYPDLFVGFTLLNPHRGEDMMIAELERCRADGHRGVKLIPHYQRYPEEGENIDIACQWAHEHRQIILNHYWGSSKQMERLLKTYPNACFFTGHTTIEYAHLMKEHDNLYVCSCPLLDPGQCETVVETIGADRFMFGSDLQDLPIAWGLGPILFSKIPPEEKRLILGDNLRRVLTEYSLETS